MMLWIVLILAALMIAVCVLVYRHDNTAFSRLTGYSFFEVLMNTRKKYLHRIMKQLDQVAGEHRILIDLQVPVNNKAYSVDAVLVHESGIYIINGIQKKGWITGSEIHPEWVETKHNKEHEAFPNPVMVNKRLIYALRDLLPDIGKDVYGSVTLFSDACSFQKIEIQSLDVEVLKVNELKSWTTQIGGEVLVKEEIEKVYQALAGYMNFTS